MKHRSTPTASRYHTRPLVSVFVEHRGRFLFIREQREGRTVISEPVGHVEQAENILRSAEREVKEETGYSIVVRSFVGIYHNIYGKKSVSDSVRFAFYGTLRSEKQGEHDERSQPFWVRRRELARIAPKLSHPTSRRALKDFLNGARFPLRVLGEIRTTKQKKNRPS